MDKDYNRPIPETKDKNFVTGEVVEPEKVVEVEEEEKKKEGEE